MKRRVNYSTAALWAAAVFAAAFASRARAVSGGEELPSQIREPKTGIPLILIGRGEFTMGGEETGPDGAELPRHRVEIVRPYYLGEFEVTVDQFRRFVAATGYVTDAERMGFASGWHGDRWGKRRGVNWKTPGFSQGSDHPAVAISFADARAFCAWLGPGYRLPSEAEWEYAAAAGNASAFSGETGAAGICSRANVADAVAWKRFPSWKEQTVGDGFVWTAPVGSYPPNSLGFYDLAGNAWEWCGDGWHRGGAGDPVGQEPWPGEGTDRRVLKGGSWYFEPDDVRPAWRSAHRRHDATNGSGFRVLLDVAGSSEPFAGASVSRPAEGL